MHWFESLSSCDWNSNFTASGRISFTESLISWRSETLQGRGGKCHVQLKSPGKRDFTFKSTPYHHSAQDTSVKVLTHAKRYVFSWKLTLQKINQAIHPSLLAPSPNANTRSHSLLFSALHAPDWEAFCVQCLLQLACPHFVLDKHWQLYFLFVRSQRSSTSWFELSIVVLH